MNRLRDTHSGGRLLMRTAALVLLLAHAAIAVSEKPRNKLQHGLDSARAVALRVLEALEEEDVAALTSLALSREEFRKYVWPELPVSNPKTNVPLDYVWNDVWFRSVNRMKGTFERFQGRKLTLVSMAHRGEVAAYPTHKAYPDWRIILRVADGKDMEYPLFGTLIEMDGLWKVYSFAPYH